MSETPQTAENDVNYVGASWPGAGRHEGHAITCVDQWTPRFENATVTLTQPKVTIDGGTLTAGRVRCSCGQEWSIGGWPLDVLVRLPAAKTSDAKETP